MNTRFHNLPDFTESCGALRLKASEFFDFLLWTGEVEVKMEERGEGMTNLKIVEKVVKKNGEFKHHDEFLQLAVQLVMCC